MNVNDEARDKLVKELIDAPTEDAAELAIRKLNAYDEALLKLKKYSEN